MDLLISGFFVEILVMNQQLRHFFSALTASLVGSYCLVSCGGMGPEFMSPPAEELSAVRLAGEYYPGAKKINGSYLVMFRESGSASNLYFSSFLDEYAHHFSKLSDEHLSDPRIKDIDVLSSVDMSGLKSVEWEPDFSMPKMMASLFGDVPDEDVAGVLARVDFEDETAAKTVLGEWEIAGKIWFAEPNEVSKLAADGLAQLGEDYKSKQIWHNTIQIPDAFKAIADNSLKGAVSEANIYSDPPVIAVLDSGVDYEHSQLKDNIWVNSQVGAAGCSGDVHGCNTTKPARGSLGNGDVWPVLADGPGQECDASNPSMELRKCDHGTHVAGIIAGQPSTENKVAGVCPMCKIMILKVTEVEDGDTSGDPTIQDDSQIRAFKYLTRFRKSGGSAVRIVNASFGKYSRSRSLAILVDVLKRVGSGTLVIAAASNEDSMIRSYPAALANAVAVASVGESVSSDSVRKSSFSNYGPWVDIAAPGWMDSTVSNNSHRVMSGTSMASPVVAGSAGLLLAAYPNLNFNQLRERILKTASAARLYGSDTEGGAINNQYYYPKVAGEEARRPLLGGGLVDVKAMLENKGNFATGQPIERVTPGCGTIGLAVNESGYLIALMLLMLPIFIGCYRRWVS